MDLGGSGYGSLAEFMKSEIETHVFTKAIILKHPVLLSAIIFQSLGERFAENSFVGIYIYILYIYPV
jgi:hypothetical protein